MKARLAGAKGEQIRLAGIEAQGVDRLQPYANALLKFEGPGSKEFPAREEYSLLQMKAQIDEKGKYNWWIDQFQFPYKPGSLVPTIQPVDDGHGHAH